MAAKILVTGGTGYIGSHTVVELQRAGYEVIIIDNLSNSEESVVNRIESITGTRPAFKKVEMCDMGEMEEVFKEHSDIAAVIHFAAYKAVGESVQLPLKYYKNNLYSLINLLEAIGDRQINLVFSSSCTVYGQPDELPVTEEAPVKKAESPYGNTKQISEEILFEASMSKENYRIISLRYFNPVGAHESAMIGELPIGIPQNLVPFITQSAIGKRGPITVYGNDYNTPDGSCIRDYIHVVDLAKAHVAAIDRMQNNRDQSKYQVYNIGTGKGISVLEVIHSFESTTGVKLDYTIGPRRAGDVEQVWGKVSKAEKELNWKAELNLEDMMRTAWNWELALKKNKD